MSASAKGVPWWQEAVIYQCYPRSFMDSDGDGVGDLRGIAQRLDHLTWLGVDAVWLNPIFPSPNRDWGFDTSDYLDVDPELGTLADFDDLVAQAERRGIRVILDLAPCHTSDEHPWFAASRRGEARYRDFYLWHEGLPDGGLPNNWVSEFSGPSWTWDDAAGRYYLHSYDSHQPDLNWWSVEVAAEFDRIMDFWYRRGVAGFRLDSVNELVKDRKLRDNPPATADDLPSTQRLGQRRVHNANQPETHRLLKRWRDRADAAGDRLLLGETWVDTVAEVARFYGDGDELHLAMNFVFAECEARAEALARVVANTERALPAGACPVWALSNHDMPRFPTRWTNGRPQSAQTVLMVLLCLRGTAILYYGDELGMPDTAVSPRRRRDMTALARDGARTPMPWSAHPHGEFTLQGATPWLPLGDVAACNVAAQHRDPRSTLHFVRRLLALRRGHRDLRIGAYDPLVCDGGVWQWRRGASITVAVNLGPRAATVRSDRGHVALSTDPVRDGERVAGELAIGPWSGLLVLHDERGRQSGC